MAKMLMIVDGRGGSDFAACRVCEFPDGGASRWQGSAAGSIHTFLPPLWPPYSWPLQFLSPQSNSYFLMQKNIIALKILVHCIALKQTTCTCVALNCGCQSDMSCGNTDCKVIQVLGRVGTTLTGGGSKTENPDMSAVTGCGIFGFCACFARYEHETYSSMLET